MRHPNEATLALHAGGDLGPVRRWLTERHLARCVQCRQVIASFDEMREMLPELAELPEISWTRMAAEIQANVRLGLEAGECVREEAPLRRSSFTGWRAAVAVASILVLAGAGVILERPNAQPHQYRQANVQSGPTQVYASADGIQVQHGDQMFGLTSRGAEQVTTTINAHGSMGTRYKDPETGQWTIATVGMLNVQ